MSHHTYAHPEKLVETDWVAEHVNDPQVRVVESDEDVLLYDIGHIPGAVKIDWHTDLQDQLIRDYIDKDRFAVLCASKGIANDTTVVFYGDKNNWWACYAFWVFKLYGHADCRVMNGGRKRWELDGRQYSRDPEPQYPRTSSPICPHTERRGRSIVCAASSTPDG
jgi:thiosulfate/3-mercaptopyruvate sulfurtransferase